MFVQRDSFKNEVKLKTLYILVSYIQFFCSLYTFANVGLAKCLYLDVVIVISVVIFLQAHIFCYCWADRRDEHNARLSDLSAICKRALSQSLLSAIYLAPVQMAASSFVLHPAANKVSWRSREGASSSSTVGCVWMRSVREKGGLRCVYICVCECVEREEETAAKLMSAL